MPRSKIVLAAYLIVALYWLLLFILTHLPALPDPKFLSGQAHGDKLAHCIAYAGLAFLLAAASTARWGFRPLTFARVLLVVGLYAAFEEWTQGFVPPRTTDWNDLVADMLGAGIGLSGFGLVEPLLRPWTEPPIGTVPPAEEAPAS
jgi:VanZ family protein